MPICTKEQLYGSNNVPRTKDIFYEHRFTGKSEGANAIFTVANVPAEGYIPLKKLYMSFCVEDPSEITFCDEVFGDFHYWSCLQEASLFKPILETWRYEASVRRKQLAFKEVIKELKEGKASFQAAKYLVEEPWKGGPTAADRKKAKAKSQESAEEAFQNSQIQDDVKRLRDSGIIQ